MVNKKKGGLSKRYQASFETKESKGGSRKGVMDWRKVDGEVNFFKPAEGKNRINIIPYVIKTKNHPLVKRGDFEIGDTDYVMDLWVHRSVGVSEASVICLKETYGKPCPICEQSALLAKEGKDKEAKDLKPKRRVFYNVQDLKDTDEIKVFEASHNLFEKELIDEARDDEEGGFVDFADVENGKEIKFRASETSFGKIKYMEFKSFGFEDRDEPIPDELVESAISFDEIMNVPTYEEVEKILYGQEDDEDDDSDEDETPKKSSKKVADDEDEDDEPAPAKKSKYRDEDDEDDEDEDDEPPKKSSKKSFDDMEDAEDETPKKACSGKCKFGHKFGVDVDGFDDCDNCDCLDSCTKAFRENR